MAVNEPTGEPIRVLVVDDQELFRRGLTMLLAAEPGFAGIAWNKEEFPDGLANVSDLWRPELKGRVEVLDEMRDTIGLIMLEQGVDIRVIQGLLGHRHIASTTRYARVALSTISQVQSPLELLNLGTPAPA